MCPRLCNTTILEHDDLVTVVDSPQPVCDEDARSGFVFEYTVDVLEKCLFGVGV